MVLDQKAKIEPPLAIKDLDVLWITAGLECDRESMAMTGAMQPSIEDVGLGAIPGLPKNQSIDRPAPKAWAVKA